MAHDKSKIFFWIFIISISIICLFSIRTFHPIVDGDGISYVEAIHVMEGGSIPSTFVPNRILTTFLNLESVILFSKIFGSIEAGWLIFNIILYFIFNIIFYKLIISIFKSDKVALLSSLFLATNYAMISFGLDYWMDIGGWVFYILSLYFTLKYSQTGERRQLLYSSVCIGIGALFKEYAFLAIIPVAIILIYENRTNIFNIVKKAFVPALFSLMPVLLVYIYIFEKFHYTYADWLSMNSEYYIYSSRIIEYIKSLGSLYNFLAFLVIGGAYYFLKNNKNTEFLIDKKVKIFVFSALASILPIFIWPAITQRILFITVPASLLIASFLFKKFERYWWIFLLFLLPYVLMNFNMGIILLKFNLPF